MNAIYLCLVSAWLLCLGYAVHDCSAHGNPPDQVPPVIGPMIGARSAPKPTPLIDPDLGGFCEEPKEEPGAWRPTPLGALTWEEPSPAERDVIYRAVRSCTRASWSNTDPWAALAIHRTEVLAGVPDGLLLAIWCWEAGMRTTDKLGGAIAGDHEGGKPRAFGPYQMHGWFWAWCGGTSERATDLVWSTNCYVSRLLNQLPKGLRECGAESAWQATEAWVANSPRYMPQGCKAKSKHWLAWEAQFK